MAGAVKKVGRLARLWPARSPTVLPAGCQFEARLRTDPLPLRSLTAAELIAMARFARTDDARRETEVTIPVRKAQHASVRQFARSEYRGGLDEL